MYEVGTHPMERRKMRVHEENRSFFPARPRVEMMTDLASVQYLAIDNPNSYQDARSHDRETFYKSTLMQ